MIPVLSFADLGAPDNTPERGCNTSETIAIVDTVSAIVQPNIHGKRWLWSEHGYGSSSNMFLGRPVTKTTVNATAVDLLHQGWATFWLGCVHL